MGHDVIAYKGGAIIIHDWFTLIVFARLVQMLEKTYPSDEQLMAFCSDCRSSFPSSFCGWININMDDFIVGADKQKAVLTSLADAEREIRQYGDCIPVDIVNEWITEFVEAEDRKTTDLPTKKLLEVIVHLQQLIQHPEQYVPGKPI